MASTHRSFEDEGHPATVALRVRCEASSRILLGEGNDEDGCI